jgi:hypothetical protein
MAIPKIIHHSAPADQSKWHPFWKKCWMSWHQQFVGFEFVFWDDNDLDILIKNHYPEYLDYYNNLPFHIMRIDFARYCIMHRFGGIYADMDMFCYKNFYPELNNEIYFVESLYASDSEEKVQNSLMCSVPDHKFFLLTMQQSVREFNNIPDNKKQLKIDQRNADLTLKITGPLLLSKMVGENVNFNIGILPAEQYNNIVGSYDRSYKTKHVNTLHWGKEVIDAGAIKVEDCHHMIDGWPLVTGKPFDSVPGLTQALKQFFPSYYCVPLSEFNFYQDYAHGNRYRRDNNVDAQSQSIKNKFEIILENFGVKLIPKT